MRHIFHIIFPCLLLISSLLTPPSSSFATTKIPAADRVKDSQKIDLTQEKCQNLFHELTNDHQFNKDFQAITQWNHSNRYTMVVSELAEAIQ